MQRNFASNLALCATLTLAQASRLVVQQAIDNLDLTGFAVMTGGDEGEIVMEVDQEKTFFEPGRKIFDVTPVSLAQTMQQTDKEHTCTHVMDIHKNTVSKNFYDYVKNQDVSYEDKEFPTNDAHYYFDGGSNETNSSMVSHSGNDSWHRISDKFMNKSLFGDLIRPEDIRQGEIGNCWFLSGITALAEYPGRIESSFLNKELSQAGVYGVQMYALGVPVTVMVDDYLPLRNGSSTRYSKIGTDGSLWGPIMEKAFAKFHGNYARIVAGDPVQSVSTMNGSPYERHWTSSMSEQAIWDLLSSYDLEKALMQAGTHSGGGRSKYGLVKNHAYVMLGVATLKDGTQLIKMRNPWGVEGYKGEYKDANMSQDVKEQLKHTSGNDGTFYMTVPEFKNDVQYVGINYNTENWTPNYFLVLNDGGQGAEAGKWNFCGATCSRYTVKMTSNVDQQVHVGAHTWRSRSYAETDKCMKATYDVERAHSIYASDGNKVFTFWNDARWMDPIEMKAGEEKTFYVELDLGRENMSPDWAVTTWGEQGSVQITVDGKQSSDAFPYVKQDHSKLPKNEGGEDGGNSDDDSNDATNNEKAVASAKIAEEAAALAKEAATSASYIMQTVDMKKSAVVEYIEKVQGQLLLAQLEKERAQKAYEDAIICCGLTASQIALGEDTTLEQLAGYIKVAKDARDAAEKAYAAAREQLAEAEAEKQALDGALADVRALHQKALDAWTATEIELGNIQRLPVDTPEQEDALARAQAAYQAAYESFKQTEAMVETAEKEEKEADAAIAEIKEAVNTAAEYVRNSEEYVAEIQMLIDERQGNDDDANDCADEVENHLVDAQKQKEKASKYKAEVAAAKASIAEHAAKAAKSLKTAEEEQIKAAQVLEEAKATGDDLAALEAALKAAKDHQRAADLAQNNAAYAASTASFELGEKLEPALGYMTEYVDKIFRVKEEAAQTLADCEKYQDTEEQLLALERAQAAYAAIEALYEDCLGGEEEAMKCADEAGALVGDARASNTNAEISKKAIDQVIEQIKILIKAAGGDDHDGDCDPVEKFQKIADQHFEDSAAAHELSQQFKEVIDEHTEAAAAHHKAVMAAHENGQATMAAAIADKWDVAALKAHREAAVAHAEAATAALEKTEAASSAAQGVKETALRQLMEEVDDLTAENQDHVAAIEELQAALEQVKDGFLQARMKHEGAQDVAMQAEERVLEAKEHTAAAQECKMEVHAFIEEIDLLIDTAENGGEEAQDDEEAEEAADECEHAQEEAKVALASAQENWEVVDEKKVGIDTAAEATWGGVAVAFKTLAAAEETLAGAFDEAGDLDALTYARTDVEAFEKEAKSAIAAAEAAYNQAKELKQAMMEPLESLPMYVEAAEAAKQAAEAAYTIAAEHDDTPLQVEAEERARNAWIAAKEHCQQARDLLADAEDMAAIADNVLEEAALSLEDTALVVFDDIFDEIDTLIEEAQNGGGDSGLADWLQTLVPNFAKKCHGKSVANQKDVFEGDIGALGFAHQCASAKKYMQIQLKGKKGVGKFSDKIATTHPDIVPSCTSRNLGKSYGWERCIWNVLPEHGASFGLTLGEGLYAANFSYRGALKNVPK